MRVEELGNLHMQISAEHRQFGMMLSEKFPMFYTHLRELVLGSKVIEWTVDQVLLTELGDHFFSFLCLKLGSIQVKIGVLGLLLQEILGHVVVRKYEINRYPAIVGKMVAGITKLGQTVYEINPIPLESG